MGGGKAKKEEPKVQREDVKSTEEPPPLFTNNQILCLTTDIHIHSVLSNMVASSYLWLFQLIKIQLLSHISHISCGQQPHVASTYCMKTEALVDSDINDTEK